MVIEVIPQQGYSVEIPPLLPSRVERLMAARELIEDEANWCINVLENEKGQKCALGAAIRADRRADHRGFRDTTACVLQYYSRALFNTGVVSVNDMHGHAAIMRLFDYAIEQELKHE